MDDLEAPVSTVHRRGTEPSLIEKFGIEGLYGYRSISLESEYAATILIAKNGTGKTTLLGALDAFLRTQFSRLRNLEFKEIRCKIRGEDADLVLTHNDVIEFLQVPTDGEIIRLSSRASIEPTAVFNFIIDEWDEDEPYYFGPEHRIFSPLQSAFNYDRQELIAALNKARASLMERQPTVSTIFGTLRRALAEYEIVYLPTYRRVELALREDPHEPRYRRRRPKFNVAAGSLFTGDIQFGLSDIAHRLSELNREIIFQSNNGYRQISASIINELLDGSFENDVSPDPDLPDREELKLFFDRIQRGPRQGGPFMHVSVPQLDKIYTGEGVPASSSKFLGYFLTKLATVIRSTKDIELPVDAFINMCNKYLLSREPSTDVGEYGSSQAIDGKALRLDRSNLRVRVESLPESRRITLDALSSGEKQMISLFAKMFLYPKKKIVLIDEPELSLSIDWQRDILVDVLSAPLCTQLIAITHSPFVFDNELEPFARAIKLARSAVEPGHEVVLEDDLDE